MKQGKVWEKEKIIFLYFTVIYNAIQKKKPIRVKISTPSSGNKAIKRREDLHVYNNKTTRRDARNIRARDLIQMILQAQNKPNKNNVIQYERGTRASLENKRKRNTEHVLHKKRI